MEDKNKIEVAIDYRFSSNIKDIKDAAKGDLKLYAKEAEKFFKQNKSIIGGFSSPNYKVDAKHIDQMFGIGIKGGSKITSATSMFKPISPSNLADKINAQFGIGKYSKSARASADVFNKAFEDGRLYNSRTGLFSSTPQEVEKTGKKAEKASSRFDKFFASVKRIALYRAIRTALKAISQAFIEGRENLYQWSKMNDGTFAKSMDSLTSSLQYMKNSIAGALAPLLENIIIPLIISATDGIATLTNRIAELTGGIKAVKNNAQYAATALGKLGIDEINTLGDSTRKNGVDIRDMFKGIENEITEENISMKFTSALKGAIESQEFKDTIKGMGKSLGKLLIESIVFVGNIFGLSDYLKEELDKIGKDANVLEKAYAIGKAIVKSIHQAFKDLTSITANFLSGWFTGIFEELGFSSSTSEKIGNFGKDAMGFLMNPQGTVVKKAWGWLKDTLGFADGGFVGQGDLFLANENGAEMVGSIGGRTAVANNDQIVEAIKQGVYEAVMNAGAKGENPIYLDGVKVGKQIVNYHNGIVRQTGSSPLLVY